ncbi:hypothetical protein BN1708_015838 [Verticillium longisporum]|uniref:2EXR domain-containing protein n=1 Tax=Verticillium longisporum TaxID=100787 RepID=A0A0G4M8S6_VERLO|nr:hypothetical protein BN1708_015838 [Verticillium longisporum]
MTMFHPFSRLPTELRLHIWNLAAEPRRVMILGISCYSYEGGAMVGHELFTSRTPVPAVLHACCEARQLPSYRKAFASQFASAPESKQDYVWVDFAADTIQCSESLVWFSPEERPLIRHLRMEVYNHEDFEEEGMPMMRELKALKSLDILYGLIQGAGLFALAQGALAAPYVSEAQTTVSAEATFTNPAIPHTNVTSHGPYEGTPTTTGALSTKVLAPSIEPLPPGPDAYKYPADGKLHGDQPAPYTPSGGIGTNGSAPQCTYNYPVSNLREYLDFSQKLTRWGESGVYGFLPHLNSGPAAQILLQSITTEARQQLIFRQFSGLFPMPVWFEVGIPQSWAWTLLAPYISSCPADTQRLIWQNFPSLHVLNQPNPARIDGANVWNETTGGYANTLSTADIEPEDACINATEVGEFCGAAISRNRTTPLSYPGRQVFLQWDAPGSPVGPNNSYITATEVCEPKFAAWVSQLNVTYSPLLNVSLEDRTAYTIQPNVSTIEGDPALNGTLFLALTDEPLYVTPYNLTQINPHVAALALYQAG